jgi:hypothetical protein
MTKLRVEFIAQVAGSSVDSLKPAVPIGAVETDVTLIASSPIEAPGNAYMARILVSDAPAYVAIGPTPDPTISAVSYLVTPGAPLQVVVVPGYNVSAILAPNAANVMGTPTDAPWDGVSPATLTALLKAVALNGVSGGTPGTTPGALNFSQSANSGLVAAISF